MFKYSPLSNRAATHGRRMGDNLKVLMPTAETLLAAGAKFGALKTGARVAGLFLRRHPAVTVATVAGAGVLWYAAKRRSARAEQGNADSSTVGGKTAIEGRSKRVDARNGNDAATSRKSTSSAGARKRTAATRASRGSGSEASNATH